VRSAHMSHLRACAVITMISCLPLAFSKQISAPQTAGYDPIESQHFASLASTTYCSDTSKILDWSCGACVDSATPLIPGKIRIIDSGAGNATRIIVGKLKDQHGCLMAFRGSNNVLNWVRDFQFWEINPRTFQNCKGCKVHSGFFKIWRNVQDEVLSAIHEVGCGQYTVLGHASPDNMLYITGHSLGAALTHMAMFTLNDAGWNISKTYSFEAPRIGNKQFSETFAQRFANKFPVYRMTHAKDPVVHLPPILLGYEHVQPEVFYDKHGNFTECQGPEDKKCADQFRNLPGLVALHSGDHCASPLVPNGDICSPRGC